MIALAYLVTVVAALTILAVVLRPRPVPAPPKAPAPAPAALPATTAPELRLILAAATQLAARLDTAA